MLYKRMTVIIEHIDCSPQFSISVIISIAINVLHISIKLALFLMLSVTHYAQNFAGVIGGPLLQTLQLMESVMILKYSTIKTVLYKCNNRL